MTFTETLAEARVLAILRTGLRVDEALRLVEAVVEGGLRLIEFPLTNPAAIEQITATRERFPDLVVGVGTVLRPAEVERARAAGAQFVVTPGLDERVTDAVAAAGLGYLPGVLTPSDIQRALTAGLSTVKLFPAGTLGTGYLAALKAPFPDVDLVATGSVECSMVVAYLDAGAHAVAVGGDLFAGGDQVELKRRASALTASIAERGNR